MPRFSGSRLGLVLGGGLLLGVGAALFAQSETPQMKVQLVTDRSASSQACGPSAIKWGFMCNIAARHENNLYAITFTRAPDTQWDTLTPIEAPVAFWKQEADGSWNSTRLEGPDPTYQTPTLLLGPDGRAHVFTLGAGHDTIYWFHSENAENTAFERTAVPMGWGAYQGGAIDEKGRALLVYWGHGAPPPGTSGDEGRFAGYKRSTVGYTVIDTKTGKHFNGSADSPGAPYCYGQVAFNKTGAHIFTVKSEVNNFQLCGSRNHYTEVRYYHSPDPASDAKWQRVVVYKNEKASIQPLGIEVDKAGRVHLLYYYVEETADGKITPHRLMYAVSKEPVTTKHPPEFVLHEVRSGGWDGRLFQTRDGNLYVLSYRVGTPVEMTQITDGLAGKFTPWKAFDTTVPQCRIFPISKRGGSTLTNDLEGVFIGASNAPEKSSMFHFQLMKPQMNADARR